MEVKSSTQVEPGKLVAAYCVLQAAAVAAWWLLLILVPESHAWFQPTTWPRETLMAFGLPDGLAFIIGSLAVAYAILAKATWANLGAWMLSAAAWYSTLYCVGSSLLTNQAWVASALMSCMAGFMLSMATIYGRRTQSPALIRVTRMTHAEALAWTFLQMAIFWSVFLWIVPKAIVEIEGLLAWPAIIFDYQSVVGSGLFTLASCLGLWSAYTMATLGSGTPLPTAAAPELVVRGPYRYVRNPMALAGIAQGVGVGVGWGSLSVVAYALTGVFVWHFCVRPMEERDLLARFGASYERYRSARWLWIPRFGHFE